MATYTEHYNLIKPALNDKVNINNLNDNADIIDTALNNKVDTDETRNITTSAANCMMSDGVTSAEDAIGNVAEKVTELIPDSVRLTYYSASSLRGTPSTVPAGCSIKKVLVCPPIYQSASLKGSVVLHNETTGELMLYGDGFTSSDSVPINFYWIR